MAYLLYITLTKERLNQSVTPYRAARTAGDCTTSDDSAHSIDAVSNAHTEYPFNLLDGSHKKRTQLVAIHPLWVDAKYFNEDGWMGGGGGPTMQGLCE